MSVKCKTFSNVIDKWSGEKSIDEFISEVEWPNVKAIVPVSNGIIFFYEIKDEEK